MAGDEIQNDQSKVAEGVSERKESGSITWDDVMKPLADPEQFAGKAENFVHAAQNRESDPQSFAGAVDGLRNDFKTMSEADKLNLLKALTSKKDEAGMQDLAIATAISPKNEFQALRNLTGNDEVTISDVDIVTKSKNGPQRMDIHTPETREGKDFDQAQELGDGLTKGMNDLQKALAEDPSLSAEFSTLKNAIASGDHKRLLDLMKSPEVSKLIDQSFSNLFDGDNDLTRVGNAYRDFLKGNHEAGNQFTTSRLVHMPSYFTTMSAEESKLAAKIMDNR